MLAALRIGLKPSAGARGVVGVTLSSRAAAAASRSNATPLLWGATRSFWGWSGDDDDGKGGDSKGAKGKPKKQGKQKRGGDEKGEKKRKGISGVKVVNPDGSTTRVSVTDPLSAPDSEEGTVVDVTPKSSDSAITRVGQGDDAPRIPSVIALPQSRRPLFPGLTVPITLSPSSENATETIKMLSKAVGSSNPYVGLFMLKDEAASPSQKEEDTSTSSNAADPSATKIAEIEDISQVYDVGTFAQVQLFTQLPDGRAQALLTGHRRVRIKSVEDQGPPIIVNVDHLSPAPYDANSDLIRATTNEVVSTFRDVLRVNPMFRESVDMAQITARFDVRDPGKVADFSTSLTTADPKDLQMVLEAINVQERLEAALLLLKKELELSKIQAEIKESVEAKLGENQRQYFLNEQLKSIKKELGIEKDDKDAIVSKFRDRLADLEHVPGDVLETIDDELNKLSSLEKNSSEFNVTRNYLDWLTLIPWGKISKENFDVKGAKEILDADHYGMDDVKDRILEAIAVGKLKGDVSQGKIICLCGPPGVGKTSIGKSIARALNREFYRFSVGGLYDVAEIKGHRRTYVGAMPGKMAQCLKTTKSFNPLVLIDEIDKMGRGHTGDPASALLEMLDPSQNAAFSDHYLDVPLDLSKTLFVCTANSLDTIPGPLLDRMEVVQLSGYDVPEKIEICKRYLEPKARLEMGLADEDEEADEEEEPDVVADSDDVDKAKADPILVPESLGISDDAIRSLIRWYCREAGVRNLQKHVEKIYRKLALKLVRHHDDAGDAEEPSWIVCEENLSDFVGKPPFTSDRLYEQGTPPGVVMGLAWTSMGGSALYIETTASRGSAGNGAQANSKETVAPPSGTLQTTGMMGDVMKESTSIARTVAMEYLASVEPTNDFFDRARIHMHVPEGATPKDGPSAGITMVTALLSLGMGREVRPDLAMTGEISLTGKVLPVGGIKEKTIAARRSGVTCLIFPVQNKRDFDELPDYLKDGLNVHYAETYEDVYYVAFSEVTE